MKAKSSLLTIYRECFKEVRKINDKDPLLYKAIVNALYFIKAKSDIYSPEKNAELLQSLAQFLRKVNNQDERAIIKMVRIFTNNSSFISSTLELKPTYQSKPLSMAKQDIQFKALNPKQQDFVLSMVRKICDKKPILKFKNVSKYLKSSNSENDEYNEINRLKQFNLNGYQGVLSPGSPWGWAFDRLYVRESDKIQKIVSEMVNRKVILV